MRNIMICILHSIFFGDQMEKNVMSGTCRTYGEMTGVYRILVGKPDGKRYHLEEPGVGGKLLKWIFGSGILRVWSGLIRMTIGKDGGHL
jgi:hypothetical protein